MLVALAAETGSAQTESTSIPEWGVTGSAPQTGSSAYTSSKAFTAPNGQPDTTAPAIPVDASPPNAAPAQTPKTVEPSGSKILILIDKLTQTMKVLVDNLERYIWDVSTGLRAYDTPPGTYAARSMNEIWYSKQWDDAPMPHAIFFTKKGHAIHGTEETQKLGRPASHGCVRLAPENARALFALVKGTGLENTEVVLTGEIPKDEVRSASHGPRKQQIKPSKNAGTALNRGRPSGKSRVAVSNTPKLKETGLSGGAKVTSSRLRKPEIKPSKKVAYPHFDPRDLEKPRRLSRKEWLRLYYSGPPQISPPRDEYEPPRRRRRALRPSY
jgi:lipoprotein-anchoring transpeptidase ErfK/SrfK